jgi:hypothetical protein
MPLFGHRARAPARPAAAGEPTTAPTTKRRWGFGGHGGGGGAQPATYSMATRPRFGQWLKVTWLDILTMVAMGAIGLGVSLSLFSLFPPPF